MKKTLLLLLTALTIASCTLIPEPEPTPSKNMLIPAVDSSPIPTPIPKPIMLSDSRLYGEFTLDHLVGRTSMNFNGTNIVNVLFYDMFNHHDIITNKRVEIYNDKITTYWGDCPIEEFGEFYQRPYYFEGDDLVIVGQNVNQTGDQLFVFKKWLGD